MQLQSSCQNTGVGLCRWGSARTHKVWSQRANVTVWAQHMGCPRLNGAMKEDKVNFMSETHQSILKCIYFVVSNQLQSARALFVNVPGQLSTFWLPALVAIMCFEKLLIWNAYGHFKSLALAELCDHRRRIITLFTVVTMPMWCYMRWKCWI